MKVTDDGVEIQYITDGEDMEGDCDTIAEKNYDDEDWYTDDDHMSEDYCHRCLQKSGPMMLGQAGTGAKNLLER